MKMVLYAFMLLFSPCQLFADTINVGGKTFTVLKQTSEFHNEDYLDTIMYITHTKSADTLLVNYFSRTGDSNSMAYTLGTYARTDTSIVVYTYWCKAGDIAYEPFGARIQEFAVDGKGNFTMLNSKLYVEVCSQYYNVVTGENPDCFGVEYLFKTPETEEEKAIFKKHIHNVEQQYNSKFVFGKHADNLLKEVREVFKNRIKAYTHYWSDLPWEIKM